MDISKDSSHFQGLNAKNSVFFVSKWGFTAVMFFISISVFAPHKRSWLHSVDCTQKNIKMQTNQYMFQMLHKWVDAQL